MTADTSASPDARALAQDITTRSARLLHEMESLREQLAALKGKNEHIRGLKVIMGALSKDRQVAQSFLADGNTHIAEAKAATRFRSSNVPSMEQHWEIVKRCRHLVALDERLAKGGRLESDCCGGLVKSGRVREGAGVYVHAVVEGGAEWIRIIGTNEKKMMIEMAEAGWDWDIDEGEEEEEDAELLEHLDLLRSAKELIETARVNWHQYRHPRIRIIFTRIHPGHNRHIDRLLHKLWTVGGDDIKVSIHCADSEWVALPPIDLDTAISNMLPRDDDPTSTVILDSSVMVALTSDVCHGHVEKKPWHDHDLQNQIDDEKKGHHFFPYTTHRLRGKKLVCTAQAQDQFHKIVMAMASTVETERARLLFEGSPAEFQTHSIYSVPDDLLLPVQVLPREETDIQAADLPSHVPQALAEEVQEHLKSVPGNQATHFYGWVSGLTVVTNNRALARKITRMVEANLTGEYEEGPRICALPYNRALATRGPGPKKAHQLWLKGLWPPESEAAEAVSV